MQVYIGVEGYLLSEGFIAKELAILHTDGQFDHYILQPPLDTELSVKDLQTVFYVTKNLNNLPYEDGYIPYEKLTEIFKGIENNIIFTYGCIATQLVQKYLPNTIVFNTRKEGFKLPANLVPTYCSRLHPPRYCAKSKAIEIKNYEDKKNF